MSRQTNYRALQKACEIGFWVPPEHIAKIAEERTQGMLDYCMSIGRTHLHEDLGCLLRSAYLQGLNDMAYAAAKQFNIELKPEEVSRDHSLLP